MPLLQLSLSSKFIGHWGICHRYLFFKAITVTLSYLETIQYFLYWLLSKTVIVTLSVLLCLCHCNFVTLSLLLSHCYCYSVTLTLSLSLCHCHSATVKINITGLQIYSLTVTYYYDFLSKPCTTQLKLALSLWQFHLLFICHSDTCRCHQLIYKIAITNLNLTYVTLLLAT